MRSERRSGQAVSSGQQRGSHFRRAAQDGLAVCLSEHGPVCFSYADALSSHDRKFATAMLPLTP